MGATDCSVRFIVTALPASTAWHLLAKKQPIPRLLSGWAVIVSAWNLFTNFRMRQFGFNEFHVLF